MTLGFLSGSKNFCKLLSEKFCLHGYDWIHWVAKSCTTIAYRWLFRDSQLPRRTLWSAVIKSPKFSARGTAPAIASSARGPCNFGPLTDLAISVFREVSLNTVLTQFHTSHRFQWWFMRRTRVWICVFRNSFIHKIFSEFLQPLRDFRTQRRSTWVGKQRVAPFCLVVSSLFVFGFGLAWGAYRNRQQTTGFLVLS